MRPLAVFSVTEMFMPPISVCKPPSLAPRWLIRERVVPVRDCILSKANRRLSVFLCMSPRVLAEQLRSAQCPLRPAGKGHSFLMNEKLSECVWRAEAVLRVSEQTCLISDPRVATLLDDTETITEKLWESPGLSRTGGGWGA